MKLDNSYRTKEPQCGNTQHLLAWDVNTGRKPSQLLTPPTMNWTPVWLKPGQLSTLSLSQAVFFPLATSNAGREESCPPPSVSH